MDMDSYKSKSAVTMFFKSDTFPFRFMLEPCVHFDFWNKKFSNLSKGPPYDLGYFSFFRKIKNLKNLKKNFYSKNKNVHMFPA